MKRGSHGEHLAQEQFGTANRAEAFYRNQMLDFLNDDMQQFIARQEMAFIASADSRGECDCSFRAGVAGFIHVLDARTIAFPEYRGNGVLASVGNVLENPHIGILFVDFFRSTVGLHVNGRARIVKPEELSSVPNVTEEMVTASHSQGGRNPVCWVFVEVQEAYIHCAKHIPLLKKLDKHIQWGTDDERQKGGNFFKVQACAPERSAESPACKEE